MDEANKKDKIDSEIERVFLTGDRKDDPAAERSIERFKERVGAANLSSDAVQAILINDDQVSAFIEETRRGIAVAGADPEIAAATRGAIDRDLGQAILTSQAEMRAEMAEIRAVTMDLKAATDKTVAATVEIKAASETIHTEVKKAVRALTVGAALRTAVYLTPFTLVSSVAGNEVTPTVNSVLHTALYWALGWKDAPTVPSTQPAPPTVNLDNRQYWIVLPPRDEAAALGHESDRPFIIPHESPPHRRPHRVVITHPKVRAHTKAPR